LEAVDPLGGRGGEGVVDGGPRAGADGDVVVLAGGLEERRVDDPDEGPGVLVDEPGAPADLEAGGAEQGAGLVLPTRGEEDRVAGLRAGGGGQTRALVLGDVLGDRPAERAVLPDRHVGEALGAALLRPVLPGVELAAGLA